MQRLAGGQWFTSRVSACGLFATAYTKSTPSMRAQLRALFRTLSSDDTPMVRRAAASSLGKFAATVEPDSIAKDLLPQFQALSMDGAPPPGATAAACTQRPPQTHSGVGQTVSSRTHCHSWAFSMDVHCAPATASQLRLGSSTGQHREQMPWLPSRAMTAVPDTDMLQPPQAPSMPS